MISNNPVSTVNAFALQGSRVTSSNFTGLSPATLVSAVPNREVLTVFNEGAGNLHISAGGTCTTGVYQVRLSAGDYWECPVNQTTLIHTAVFAVAGTARVTEVN
jgi:hypothetical protein